ncbi:hypothetical protein A6770_38360 [Nostoc minutum NIES-26]|uniref:Uncharacterized protein n=1 Tax=Nostoc minutum NIES-26 TaxID=1844469 RepID=A0A367RXZ4_9NOSO|nr:hypothetical protein A6770_38360 [Nostoc minutum NIES-26]
MAEIKLGLGNPPLPVYLYVKKLEINGQVYGWYNFDVSLDKQTPVHQRALTGYLSELQLTDKDYKGKDNLKLDIFILADELYVVRSGIETNFTKSFLLAASVVEDFSKPLTIVANPGEENVVFCALYDAITKTKIRRDWDVNVDWAELIQQIQAKLSGSLKYDLEEDERDRLVVEPPSATPPKSAAVHPQDARIKQIRTLLDYPVDLVKEWLHFQDVKFPNQLPINKVDELVKTMCLAWAADKLENPNHAWASYQQQVLSATKSRTDETAAIRVWMNYVAGQRTAVSSRS